ncbi:stage II sporulation protein B [Peribacillus deserti]|uniref:Stage II sporulation protein B n=1 Tax=Peribacillus deserti TaxID=673318 RepID=A0ABS2QFK0_9BACI|nr:SPOR domain-containing protein [Peribacillus deserti]MBM7691925.1 stage II sporulation protein B [Peribacillus deserti]
MKEEEKNKIVIKFNGGEKHIFTEADEAVLSMDETAAASESAEESFDWILPEPGSSNEKNSLSPYVIKTKKTKSTSKFKGFKGSAFIPSMWISILLAVVVGTSLGFIVLKTVTGKHSAEEQGAVPASSLSDSVSLKDQSAGASTGRSKPPPLKAFVVQGGIYSTEKSAKTVQNSLSASGIPVKITEHDDKYVLLLGVADSIEHAKSLAVFMKEKKIDSFWKEMNVSGKSKQGLTSKEASYLKDLTAVYQMLSEKTASNIMEATSSTKGDKLKSGIEKVEKHGEIQHKNLAQMEKAIKEASSLYLSSTGTESLYKTQSILLDFLVLYSNL